jgi:hypothetical protein
VITFANTDRFMDRVKAAMLKRAEQSSNRRGIVFQNEVKRMLNLGASNRGKTPSTPPNPPHKDTGHMARNVRFKKADGPTRRPARVWIPRDVVPYAWIHEHGGEYERPRKARTERRRGYKIEDRRASAQTYTVRVPARPFWRPAYENVRAKMADEHAAVRDLLRADLEAIQI